MSDSSSRSNRLAGESSPYLLLHARNPVDWYPWGEEAIARARREDKPIFLSVGYSTCYWCHVMERESFSDAAVAEELNRHFVSVKVDREERPDVDEIYMLATQVLAGQGGWPNSVFLTPRLEPFFAGTYFPPSDAHGRPGFPTVLRSMVHAWTERRDDVEEQAGQVAEAIRHHLEEIEPWREALPGGDLLEASLTGLRQRFDPTWGGFGQQPKFPTPSNLWLLAELAPARPAAAMMLAATLDAMARGGIHDQLAGGFHRYSTDREWKVPHFEKMLYDNGLLLEIYAEHHARTGDPTARRAALAVARWLEREMTSPEGAFWSALDAETGGREGAYYLWTFDQIVEVLGEEDAAFLAPLLGFAGEPFFEGDAYVLHLPRSLDVQAGERRTDRASLEAEIDRLQSRLLEARWKRERPRTDDKLLADWNGTAIAGLAVAGRRLDEPELVARAERAADFLLGALRGDDGSLLHSWRQGAGRIEAFLSDYVHLIRGLLRLYDATSSRRWLDAAVELQDEQARRLGSDLGGYFNAPAAEDLLVRGKEMFDGAIPAANGVAVINLIDLAAATGDGRYLAEAERALRAFAPIVSTHPDGARTLVLALHRFGLATGNADAEPRLAATATAGPRERMGDGETSRAIIEPRVEIQATADGGTRSFVLRFAVREGWHLAAERGLPALEGVGVELEEVEWPPAQPLMIAGGQELAGHAGELVVRGRLRAAAGRGALRLRFVACGEERCLPEETLELAFATRG